jgi:tRNA threonylcarbamoyladenosine biosynthesis protein TsaB
MLLAVDTSNQMMGLAIYDGSQVLGETMWQSHNFHTVELAPAVENLLKRCGMQPKDLQVLAVASGPGSFTALRIGMAFVKGMALGLHCPLIGIHTLDILAAAQPKQEMPLLSAIQVGRGRLAVEWYSVYQNKWKAQGELKVISVEDLAGQVKQPALVCGELTAIQRQALTQQNALITLSSPAHCVRRPSFLAELAWERWQSNEVDATGPLSPIYLHSEEGEQK